MRVLHISNDYHYSDVYPVLHQGFLQSGLDSVFFVPMPFSESRRGTPHVLEVPCFHGYDRYLFMNKQRKIYRQFRQAVEREMPDLLHGYFLYSAGILCLWAKREIGIPYAVTVQNTDLYTQYRWLIHLRGLAWEVLREAEDVLFVSPAYRGFVLEHMVPAARRKEAASKFHLLPFAVNPFWTAHANVAPHLPHEGPIRLLTVGAVNRNKNQLRLAQAVELLAKQGMYLELSVVGASEDKELDRQLQSHAIVRRVEKLPKEQLIEEYRRADLFALPSLTESFGLVYAEALSQGLPVIYSAGQGFDGQFPEGYVGYRVDAWEPKDIAAGIQHALKEYGSIQKNCSEAAARFTQERVCRESAAIYRSIASAGRNT